MPAFAGMTLVQGFLREALIYSPENPLPPCGEGSGRGGGFRFPDTSPSPPAPPPQGGRGASADVAVENYDVEARETLIDLSPVIAATSPDGYALQ